ncbi:MAG: SGNH hydrolase domain-containing protein [Microthrixaceae bacterium]|nr:SGNH hydrolase domain-containing protein [Microthrixaceae bacterium]
MQEWPDGEFDPEFRDPDGVHLTPDGVGALAAEAASTLEEAKPPVDRADPTAAVAANAPLPAAPAFSARRTAPAGSDPTILVVGDSVAYNIGYGLTRWARSNGEAEVHSAGQMGCPIARGGQFRFTLNIDAFEDRCDWSQMFPKWVDSTDPEVAVLASGIWEVVDRRLLGDDRFRHVGQPIVDRYVLAEFLSAIDTLSARGANVVVLTYPHFEAARDQGYTDLPESDPARVDRLNEILAEAVALRPGVATLADFQGWLASQPGGELDPAKRSDGLHFYDEYAPRIAEWLGPQLVDIARNGIPPPGG